VKLSWKLRSLNSKIQVGQNSIKDFQHLRQQEFVISKQL